MKSVAPLLPLLLLLLLSPPSRSSPLTSFSMTKPSGRPSPLSPSASLLRYWSRKVSNGRRPPAFFASKLSPLSPLDSATFSSLAPSDLGPRLPAFCSAAGLLCSNSTASSAQLSRPSLGAEAAAHDGPSDFRSYLDSNFTNYASSGTGFSSSFKNYSDGDNLPVDTFRRYSRDAVGDEDSFAFYSVGGNVVTTNFTSYSTSATGGSGGFSAYQTGSNVEDLKFTNYDAGANGPERTFSAYAADTNSGEESFAGYGKGGNGVPTTFMSYSDDSNVMGSDFKNYGEGGNGAADKFSSYGRGGNVPELGFSSYGAGGNGGADDFKSYRNQSNVGDDNFASYGKQANVEQASFAGYGESFNEGSDGFMGYGEGSTDDAFNFTSYAGELSTFKAYYNLKDGNQFSFKSYVNASTVPKEARADSSSAAEEETRLRRRRKKTAVNRWVEPGKFFRESNLKKGTVMPMPDIRDRTPPRSFLPRSISGRIPFSAGDVRRIFRIRNDTAMGKAVGDTVAECGRAPSRGETKRCAASAEDMIDFAVEVLGPDVVVRSTESAAGSRGNVAVGDVRGVNGGKVTRSVSCHQSLFPYLVYYCHSVPKVRVYEADLHDPATGRRINRGVAICHLDTSAWSAGHGAFAALGSAPGEIEVCHWIFEGDMTWATAD